VHFLLFSDFLLCKFLSSAINREFSLMPSAYWARTLLLIATLFSTLAATHAADKPFIVVQSTTSTQNSGLLDAILPMFTKTHGIDVRVVAVGTGQAIRNAANGDGDVLLVHAKSAEEKFIADGFGVQRFDLMYNDFVLVGPANDPAGINGGNDIIAALITIAQSRSLFASRGDDSGTHKAELRLWKTAAVDAMAESGKWYRETGSGMGATLNIGTAMGAYVLTDRAMWIAFGNKGDYQIVVENDGRLFNQYGVMLVNPKKHANVRAEAGQLFIDWLLGTEGQKAIGEFIVGGQQLFFPNADIP
jgi:tungstate transport system substrate-binding protein